MLLERLWIKLWAPFVVISLFLIFTLFHVWPLLSPLMHRLALALFAMGFIASFYPLLSLRLAKDKEALKRLDKNSTLPHQPAQAFKDRLEPNLSGMSNSQTEAIWLQFKNRLVEKIKQLKVRPPQPETYKQDPYALRMVLMLIVACGLFFQSGNIQSLIANAVTLPPMINTSALRVDAWVTPPSYTGKAPILIADGSKNSKTINSNKSADETNNTNPVFTAPENSTLTIRINGTEAKHVEVESLNQQIKSTKETPSKKVAQKQASKPIKTKEFHLKLTKNGPVKLTIDTIPLKDWRFEITPDNPPIIGLVELPAPAQSRALKLKYRVVDDYGVIEAKAHVKEIFQKDKAKTTILNEEERPLGAPIEYPLNLSEQGTKSSEDTTYKDLTDHPWAGLPITLYLSATDEGENSSNSPEINIVLPEYKFTKPIAKNIIRLRKQLIMTPSESPLLAELLYTLLNDKKPFEKDLTLYLGLKVTANRLLSAQARQEKEDISKLLYQLARHAEDGDLSAAERELRTAQEELRKALQENASAKEIQKRIDNLRKALQKYMQALAKQQQKNQNEQAQNQNTPPNQRNMSPEDFEQMLKTIEELSKSGAKDLANQMLSQLQNMLENLQTGKNQNQQQQNRAAKNLEELGKILQEQQRLMDKTFEQNRKQNRRAGERNQSQQRNAQQGNQSQKQNGQPQGNNGLEQQQQALRQQLQKLMRELEKARQAGKQGQKGLGQKGQQNRRQNGSPLENADRAMQRAEELLKGNDLGNALSQEGQALDQLRKGMQQMAKDMQGMSGNGGGKKSAGKDPLGRNQGAKGMDTSESTKVPDKIDIQRAREILRNLQNKLSDPNRPAPEIDYIERLLKRF